MSEELETDEDFRKRLQQVHTGMDWAVGKQLDMLGCIVGLKRKGSKEDYMNFCAEKFFGGSGG